MGRKKKGIPIHGWLIIDKPLEISSNSVVGKTRWLTKAQKVGHGGTLDPLASGVLPLAFGEATKTVSFVMDGQKTYRFEVTWGESRSTDDGEGEVVATSDHRPEPKDIQKILSDFVGEIEQVPPKYSALKINGQRAYKLARADEDVEMKPRTVQIDRLELIEIVDANRAVFEVDCGKGTYVRSIGRDLGVKLGCLGYISMLRRTKVGPFSENDAISLDLLEDIVHSDALFERLLAIETVLDDISALALSEDEAQKIRHGMSLKKDMEDCDLLRLMADGKLVALAKVTDGVIHPFRGFNY
jgi:tRNA pseudouridine55 synthase